MEMDYNVYTISEITKYIKKLLSGDDVLSDLWLGGEISNFYHHDSGHMYFTLKDDSACIDAIMFKGNNRKLKFEPEEGMEVTAHGYVSVYEPRGDYQFYVDKLQPEGEGALYLAFKQLKEKLKKEGLFAEEEKRTIPQLPAKIGVVTSPTGAAIRDILSVVERRFKNVSILIVPSLVQGDKAAGQIVNGIEYLNNRDDIDLIIVARGGGSLEDLWPFNEEKVARKIFNSEIPVISGVGHETDFTITDFVADLRAPTPSAAAELAISNRLQLEKNLENLTHRLFNALDNKISHYREKVKSLTDKRIFIEPEKIFADQMQQVDELSKNLQWNMDRLLNKNREKFNILQSKLDTLSPLKTLKRGYSISLTEKNKVIKSVKDVQKNEFLITRVADGEIYSRIQEIKFKENGDNNE